MNNDTFDFLRLEDNYIYSKKTVRGGVETMETTPHVWAMSLVRIESGYVTIKVGEGARTFPSGMYGSFLPPFSFIEYHGRFERMEMTTISSAVEAPSLPSAPLVFPIASLERFSSLQEAASWLKTALKAQPEPVRIGRGHNPSSISLKIKRTIDRSYAHPLKLADLADRLHLSQALLTMHFKKGFFLPPVKYRNCLRLIDSLMRLARGQQAGAKVIDIAQEVGFADLSQFNRQFKAYFGVTPSAFLL